MEAGDRFGDYVILKRLAAGGMAEVYLARKSGLRGFTKPVAMKVILPHLSSNERFIKMFLAEARLAVHLEHAHIAQTLDLGEVNGQYFIISQKIQGKIVQLGHIATDQQRSSKERPEGYMGILLIRSKFGSVQRGSPPHLSDNQHIRIIPVAGSGIFCQTVLSIKNIDKAHAPPVCSAIPAIQDIFACAP